MVKPFRVVPFLLMAGAALTSGYAASPPSIKSAPPTVLFRIPWGDGPGKFHYQESEMGFELDTYPRKFVRDSQGNFYFLEPGPPARLSKFTGDGHPLYVLDLVKLFPAATSKDVIMPQEIFLRTGDHIAAFIRIYLRAEKREEVYLATFDPTGHKEKLVRYANFRTKPFMPDDSSVLDKDGYLWALCDGKETDVYGPAGDLLRTIPVHASYVDTEGLLFSDSFNSVKIFDRNGGLVGKIPTEGGPGSTDGVDGIMPTGAFYSWRHGDSQTRQGVTTNPRFLDFYRSDPQGKMVFLSTVILRPSRFRQPNPHSDYVERTALYEDRLVFDDAGNMYFLGRSPKDCWIEKVELKIAP
jgi:hypothetical protein